MIILNSPKHSFIDICKINEVIIFFLWTDSHVHLKDS